MRRKGERPVQPWWPPYDPSHPVVRLVAEGEHWLQAWIIQVPMPYQSLSKKSLIAPDRIAELLKGAEPNDTELEAFAGAFGAPLADMCASLRDWQGRSG